MVIKGLCKSKYCEVKCQMVWSVHNVLMGQRDVLSVHHILGISQYHSFISEISEVDFGFKYSLLAAHTYVLLIYT